MTERPFHRGMSDLVARVVHMASLSRRCVFDGVEAFVGPDAALARTTIRLDADINRLDVEIEAGALDLIGLHQPMARDLRTLAACLKIITYLDRIGRYGYDCAQATLALEGPPPARRPAGLLVLRDKALGLLDVALAAFQTHDAPLAGRVASLDDEVDALYDQFVRDSVTRMIEDPRTIPHLTAAILVARHLERVGDNANKIAEKTIYLVEGRRRLDLGSPPAPSGEPRAA